MLYSFLLFCPFLFLCDAIEVETSYGRLEGKSIRIDDTTVHVFKGVPLAEPPVGDLRFELPRKPRTWRGIRDATRYSAACLSNSTVSSVQQKWMSEDCLYLNIITSQRCLHSRCPVIVYLHGGVLNYDSAVMYNETFIAERYAAKDVVFVIPAMRLGVFGLLAMENETIVPRNIALYDIIAGLEYVHNEVRHFGGDAREVTVMGHSMGGAIGIMMAFSKTIDPSHRLIHRVISLSGDVFWMPESRMINLSRDISHAVGCHNESEKEMLNCLRSIDSFDLLAAQRDFEERGKTMKGVLFGTPLTDGHTTVQQFIADPPKRDLLVGSISAEFIGDDGQDVEIGHFLGLTEEKRLRQKFYEDQEKLSRVVPAPPTYLSQVIYCGNVVYGTEMKKKGANVYIYEYSESPLSYHSIDLPYIIGAHRRPLNENTAPIDMFYSNMITNFAKYGKPHEDWQSFDVADLNYYALQMNVSHGIRPHNQKDYHRDIHEYWTEDMVELDQSVKVADRSLSDVTASERASTWTYIIFSIMFIMTMITLITIINGKTKYPNAEGLPLL